MKWPYKGRIDPAHAWGVIAVGTTGLAAIPAILATLHATDAHFRWWWPTNWMAVPAAIFLIGVGLTVLTVGRPEQAARAAADTGAKVTGVVGVSRKAGDEPPKPLRQRMPAPALKPARVVGQQLRVAAKPAAHAFISYVREDARHVDQLEQNLQDAGIPVWRDTADLWPGQDWRVQIRDAITGNALVFLACFSQASLALARSHQNEELLLAIEQFRLRRPEDPWLIPIRFDECEIPDRDIGGGRALTSLQPADLFGDHCLQNTQRLIQAIHRILANHPRPSEDSRLAGDIAIGKSSDPWSLLIDELLLRLDLENWDDHVGGLLRSSKGMHSSSRARLLKLAIWLNSRILPDGQPELKHILSTLQKVIVDLLDTFDIHCEEANPEQRGPWLRTAPFYKMGGWRPSRDAEVELYNAHINLLSDMALELTRVVNWLCGYVRREFNPMFQFEQGAIQIEGGPFSDGDVRWFRPEYSFDELSGPSGPYESLESFKMERYARDFHTGS